MQTRRRRGRSRLRRPTRVSGSLSQCLEQPLLVGQAPGDDRAPRVEQLEHALVVDAVEDARALPARLDDPEAPQRGEVLGGRARVEPELGLERADGTFALPQQLEDPDADRMAKDAKEARLDLVDGKLELWLGSFSHMKRR